ncbi:hypothetical protein DdX_18628 [Ditylenchus destructor]|uniref:Uncharacterized protein n=1 Tax=Ditylenchus destructor TaxID=166010 RepID=A0AAD4MPP8_9BILA|nr:hypothetical protein DdX_18628 [Ditylenchus destructor]
MSSLVTVFMICWLLYIATLLPHAVYMASKWNVQAAISMLVRNDSYMIFWTGIWSQVLNLGVPISVLSREEYLSLITVIVKKSITPEELNLHNKDSAKLYAKRLETSSHFDLREDAYKQLNKLLKKTVEDILNSREPM